MQKQKIIKNARCNLVSLFLKDRNCILFPEQSRNFLRKALHSSCNMNRLCRRVYQN